jgi:hypothetical protein
MLLFLVMRRTVLVQERSAGVDSGNVSKLALGALLIGASALSGNALLGAVAGGIGVNWASEALGGVVAAGAPGLQPGSALARAYERALRRAVAELRRQYQQQYGKQEQPTAFALLAESAGAVAQAEYPRVADIGATQQELARGLDGLLHGHAERQVAWLKANLLEQTALAFQQELANDPEAWRLLHGWLLQTVAQQQSALGRTVERLPEIMRQLQNPGILLDALDDATGRLAAMLDALRAELQRIAAGGAPAPARTHAQTVSGNAQVGVAVAGDVHGPITYQTGGINFGSGNTIGSIGDVVAGDKIGGDKVSGDKVMGDKVINYGAPRPADTAPEHLRRLIELHTRRLRVLDEQATRAGYNARPEVLNEIDDIRAEIARLQALLEP